MKICPEESELQPLQGRVKRTLMLGPEARGSDPGRTAPRTHEGARGAWPVLLLPLCTEAPCPAASSLLCCFVSAVPGVRR